MTDTPTFETFVASERTRISKERDKLIASKADIDTKLSALDQELRAIAAYENVKAGRTTTSTKSRASGGIRRPGQRDAVLAVIKAAVSGISPTDVLAKMGATINAEKTSVRNALSALKRNGLVHTKDGNYHAKA